MGIMRVAKNSNYTVMNRTALNDTRLSWKAKGIIAYMLSMPDDWVFYTTELVKHSTDGEKSFRAGFKELKEFGYVKRFPIYESNKITNWETVVYETPEDCSSALEPPLLAGNVQVQKVDVQNVQVRNVQVQNDALLSTDNTNYLNKPSTDKKLSTEQTNKQASLSDSKFGVITNLYQNNLPLSKFKLEELGYIYDAHGYELTLAATKEMLSTEKVRQPIRYIEGILNGWKNDGIKNITDLYNYRKRGENNGNLHARSNGQSTSQNGNDPFAGYSSN